MAKNEKLLEWMTEPELREFFNDRMELLKRKMPKDGQKFMLLVFQDDGISQYAASIQPEGAIKALRELADRLERRETVTR